MKALFSKMARQSARVFAVTFLGAVGSILALPDFGAQKAAALAAVLASIAAGVKALEPYVPFLSIGGKYGPSATVALQTALVAFFPFVYGALGATDLKAAQAALVAGSLAAGTAVARALEGLLTSGEYPAPTVGLDFEE